MNFRRKKHAISYIMEVVMMTLVITALASVVLTWGLSAVSDSRTALTGAVNARINRVQEYIIIEDVQMVDSIHMRVWIRNSGSVLVVVDQVYTANAQSTTTGICAPNVAPSGSPPFCPSGTKLSLPVQALGAVDLLVPSVVNTCTVTGTTTSVSSSTTITATTTSTLTSSTTTVMSGTTYTAGVVCGGNTYLVIASTTRGTTTQGSFTV